MTAPERLDDAEWEMLADWQAPGVRLARTVERIVAQHVARAVAEARSQHRAEALREAADAALLDRWSGWKWVAEAVADWLRARADREGQS